VQWSRPATGATVETMARYVFSSHDGFGVGHVRRNVQVAHAVLAVDPGADIVVVTGLTVRPSWLGDDRIRVERVPGLVKDADGAYRNDELPFATAVERRAVRFAEVIAQHRPNVVVVDRHPFGIAGELRPGLAVARAAGAATVLGLRDILDEPAVVAAELAGAGWRGVTDTYDSVIVYGERVLCDHVAEYGLPLVPEYCGWVVEAGASDPREHGLLVVTAGGAGDGDGVFALGLDVCASMPEVRAVLVAGPYATSTLDDAALARRGLAGRIRLVRDTPGCGPLYARADRVVQMAGYNSTFECLAAGIRPVLVPRRTPRREQVIRATRLAALGLADVVDEPASAAEVAWLLRRPRALGPTDLVDAGIRLDGAGRAADRLVALAERRTAAA
jgi:predicted glycosyltransferase